MEINRKSRCFIPYITQELRDILNTPGVMPNTPGQLNYVITSLVHKYLIERGMNYYNLNEAVGVLECAKAELLRVVVGPYEEKKRRESGSISELDSLNLEDVR